MLFDLVLPFGLWKFSNSCVMKHKNGFWSGGEPHPCIKLSKKNSCFSSDILVLQRRQTKKAKTPLKIIPSLPNTHFPIPSPSCLCKNQRSEGTCRVQLVQPSLQADWELRTLSPSSGHTFLSSAHVLVAVRNSCGSPPLMHCLELSLLSVSLLEKALWRRAVLFSICMGNEN